MSWLQARDTDCDRLMTTVSHLDIDRCLDKCIALACERDNARPYMCGCRATAHHLPHKLDKTYTSLVKFYRRERAKAARSALNGNANGQMLTRDYRILVQSRGTIEGKALNQLRRTLHTKKATSSADPFNESPTFSFLQPSAWW